MVRTAPQRTSEAPRKVRKKSDSLSKNFFRPSCEETPWRLFILFAGTLAESPSEYRRTCGGTLSHVAAPAAQPEAVQISW